MSDPNLIHPSAIIGAEVKLGPAVSVGPYTIIEGDVQIGEGCVIDSNVRISGKVTIGKNNRIMHGTVIGMPGQDLTSKNPNPEIIIGHNNVFRENCTVHHSTKPDKPTRIGSDCFLMVAAHVAHDCTVGDRVILVNNSMLGGHAVVQDAAFIGGGAAVHQYCRVGTMGILGAVTKISHDVAPFTMANGNPAVTEGLNAVAMKRAGFSPAERAAIKECYKILFFRNRTAKAAMPQLEDYLGQLSMGSPEQGRAMQFVSFVKESGRGITPNDTRASADSED